jgi:hypothetical protein
MGRVEARFGQIVLAFDGIRGLGSADNEAAVIQRIT